MDLTRRTFLKGTIGTALAGCVLHAKRVEAANNRVVWVRDANVTTWNGSSNWFGSDTYVSQTRVDNMIAEGVKRLTGQATELGAWQTIIPTYSAGTKIGLKTNWNSYTFGTNVTNPTPQVTNAVIRGLKLRGVAESDIWLIDASNGQDGQYISEVHDLYPGVYYYTDYGRDAHPGANVVSRTFSSSDPSLTVAFTNPAITDLRMADQFSTLTHLIHMPIFRAHGSYGVTLTYKNLFGVFVRTDIPSLHAYISTLTDNALVDIFANSNVGGKTRLIIGDGIYGNYTNNTSIPTKWGIFGTDWPKSIFLSTDPVAIDSVMWDFINWQSPKAASFEYYLHEAASHGQGSHGHWNNPTEKKYSVIDFVQIDMENLDLLPAPPQNLRIIP